MLTFKALAQLLLGKPRSLSVANDILAQKILVQVHHTPFLATSCIIGTPSKNCNSFRKISSPARYFGRLSPKIKSQRP